jgi:PAS domain S-box-containing protein
VTSHPGEGACFSLRFPLGGPAHESGLAGSNRPIGRPAIGGAEAHQIGALSKESPTSETEECELPCDAIRILLVEDDPGAGFMLKRMMAKQGVRVMHVTSGQDAIEAFDQDWFDAVVTDVMLGDMTGVDVLRSIRETTMLFPVILLTGHDSIGSAIEALRLGAQDYIRKPLQRIEDLVGPVQKAVSLHRLQVESEKLTEELRVSEQRFRSLAELLPETVLEADISGRITFMNRQGMEKFGIGNDDLNDGYDIALGVSREETELLRSTLGRLSVGEAMSGIEFTGVRKSGETFPVLTFSAPLRSNGGISGFRSIVVDISARKEAEKAILHYQEMLREMDSELQLTEERERCSLASDLHDSVAQLLAATRMRIELAHRVSDDPKLNHHLNDAIDIITEAINQTRSLVFQLSPPSLYAHGLGDALNDLAGHMLRLHSLDVTFVPPAEPFHLAERERIHVFRAARELLVNVAKHADVNECRMTLERRSDNACVVVEDDGVGFETDRVEEGSTDAGFGLFGIRERLRTIGGNLVLASSPGGGTTATIRVPLPADDPQEPA